MTISALSTIRLTEQHLETPLEGETIVMHVKSGMIYAVADTANAIWSRLSRPITFEALIDAMIEQFSVDRETCIRDVTAFLHELEGLEIIEIVPPELDQPPLEPDHREGTH